MKRSMICQYLWNKRYVIILCFKNFHQEPFCHLLLSLKPENLWRGSKGMLFNQEILLRLLKSSFLKASNIIHITQNHVHELCNTPAWGFSDALAVLYMFGHTYPLCLQPTDISTDGQIFSFHQLSYGKSIYLPCQFPIKTNFT